MGAMDGERPWRLRLSIVLPILILDLCYARILLHKLSIVNERGPYVGIIVPNAFEMNPLFTSGGFQPDTEPYLPYLDIGGRRFHIGGIEGQRSIVVMTGLAMLNAGITTEELLDLFEVRLIVHYGIAGSSDNSLNIGDVGICNYWAHTGLWNWQRYGQGPNDELPFEDNGDSTREIGYLQFGDYNVPSASKENLLNNIWFQPEEVFLTPEQRQQMFWVPVNKQLYQLATTLENLELESCVNSTLCLTYKPKVVFGLRGATSNIFVDNSAYRNMLYNKFNISVVEMESAAVALTCYSKNVPHIVIRSISDMAGGSNQPNEETIFSDLAVNNAVLFTKSLIRLLEHTFTTSSAT